MITKAFLVGIFALMLALNASAQNETNPKLVSTFPAASGKILVVDVWDIIQTSNFTTDDLGTMKKSIQEMGELDRQQKETIKKQDDEISKLQREIQDMKSDYKTLLNSFKDLQKKVDDIERKLH